MSAEGSRELDEMMAAQERALRASGYPSPAVRERLDRLAAEERRLAAETQELVEDVLAEHVPGFGATQEPSVEEVKAREAFKYTSLVVEPGQALAEQVDRNLRSVMESRYHQPVG